MEKILITGGAGFIGSNLALKLLDKGYVVTILDNLSPQIHGNNPEVNSPLYNSIKGKVNFIKGSVTSFSDWSNAINGQDAVIHLAAETGTGQSMYAIHRYVDVNTIGTAILLDILANNKHTIKKMIVASSRAVYGEGKYFCPNHSDVYPQERSDNNLERGDFECKCPICNGEVEIRPTSEDSKLHPTSVYGITKLNQEQMIIKVGKSLNIPSIAFRYQNVYGPGQSLSNPYTGILSIFSTLIKNGDPINVFEDGKESRDFVFIDDVTDATILGIEQDNIKNEVFNVGSGEKTDVLSVAKILTKEYKSETEIKISGNYRLGDIRHNYSDLAKIRSSLNYTPQVSFKTGISRFVQWVNGQQIGQSRYTQSIEEMRSKGLLK